MKWESKEIETTNIYDGREEEHLVGDTGIETYMLRLLYIEFFLSNIRPSNHGCLRVFERRLRDRESQSAS